MTACSDDPDPPSRAELTDATVGVVVAGCGLAESSASGVIVSTPETTGAETLVVTSAHTLRGVDAVTVVDANGAEHAATVIVFDKDADLAALRVPTLDMPPLDIGDVTLGAANALVWGAETGATREAVEVTKRLRITIEDIFLEEIVERNGIELAGPIEQGDSGGAIVNGEGEVIGVIYASSRQRDAVGFAVDASEVREVIDVAAGAGGNPVNDLGQCR